MSELDRLGLNTVPFTSVQGVGLTRAEHNKYSELSDPNEFIDKVVETKEYEAMSNPERSLSLQLIIDQFQDDAEKSMFDTENQEFRDLRQRIREAQ